MWSAISERNSKSLGRTHRYIRTQFTGRSQQGQGQQIGSHHHIGTGCMHFFNKAAVVFNGSFIIRVLNDSPEISGVNISRLVITFHQFNLHRCGTGQQYILGLRKYFFIYKELWSLNMILLIEGIKEHRHGFCCCRGFIQQGGIGNGQSGQVTHHGLIIQQAFQSSL